MTVVALGAGPRAATSAMMLLGGEAASAAAAGARPRLRAMPPSEEGDELAVCVRIGGGAYCCSRLRFPGATMGFGACAAAERSGDERRLLGDAAGELEWCL